MFQIVKAFYFFLEKLQKNADFKFLSPNRKENHKLLLTIL